MRGRRKQIVGRGAAEDADRGAITGGGTIAGNGEGGGSTTVSTQPSATVKLEDATIVPKKRKRISSGESDRQLAGNGNEVEHYNGVDHRVPDRDYPELGITLLLDL